MTSAIEKVIYTAGAVLAGLACLEPDGLWRFPVNAVAGWVFPFIVGVALCAALAAPASLNEFAIGADTGDEHEDAQTCWRRHIVAFVSATAVLWLLRCRTFYGDSGAIIGFINEGVVFHKREPLSPTLFLLAQRTIGDALSWAPQLTIQVVNTLAGALGIVLLMGIARRIAGASRAHRVAAAAVLVSSGCVQLFAGYVENYTLPVVCMLGSIVCGLDAFAGRRGLTCAFGLWTLSCMFHLGAIVFAPAMVCLAWHQRHELRVAIASTAIRLLAVTVLPALALYGAMLYFGFHRSEERGFGGGDGLMFVPLFELTGMSQYLFLRPPHLLAIANQQLLVAPLGVVMVVTGTIAALWGSRWQTWRQRVELTIGAHTYLVLVATSFLALTVIWNPDLGPERDWDLFGPVGYYLNICGVALLCSHLRTYPGRLLMLLVFVATVNASRTLPFVLHNAGF